MKRLRLLVASLIVASVAIAGMAQEALAAPMDELIASAKKEGVI